MLDQIRFNLEISKKIWPRWNLTKFTIIDFSKIIKIICLNNSKTTRDNSLLVLLRINNNLKYKGKDLKVVKEVSEPLDIKMLPRKSNHNLKWLLMMNWVILQECTFKFNRLPASAGRKKRKSNIFNINNRDLNRETCLKKVTLMTNLGVPATY